MYHMIAFVGGFLLDLLLGDPYTFPHPVRLIGRFIAALENHFLGEKGNEKMLRCVIGMPCNLLRDCRCSGRRILAPSNVWMRGRTFDDLSGISTLLFM